MRDANGGCGIFNMQICTAVIQGEKKKNNNPFGHILCDQTQWAALISDIKTK